jgi:ribosomal protein S14
MFIWKADTPLVDPWGRVAPHCPSSIIRPSDVKRQSESCELSGRRPVCVSELSVVCALKYRELANVKYIPDGDTE